MTKRLWAGAALALASGVAARAQAPSVPAPSAPAQSATAGATVEQVQVVAGAQPKQTRIDRTVYNVAHDLQATSGTAADVLATVPSVDVDQDGNVTLRGDPNVTILVDGKPSAQFAGATRGLSLQQFPASEIDHIEVLTAPPAQYKAEGSGGVINIVTKKRRAAGTSGAGQFLIGDKRRYVAGLDGAENVGPLRLSGGVVLRRDAKERITDDNRVTDDPVLGPQAGVEHIDEQFRRFIPSAKGEIGYDFNAKRSLTASFSTRQLTGDRYFDQSDQTGPVGAPADSLSLRHSDGHEWAIDGSEGLRFDQTLGKGETLSLGVQRSATGERERYFYTNTYPLPPAPVTYDDLHLGLDLAKTEVSADYTRPIGAAGELKAGYDLEDDRNAYDNWGHTYDPVTGQPVLDPNVSNDFRYRQRVDAWYGQVQGPFKDWRVQAGVRIETAHIDTYAITTGQTGGRNDFGVYPSLHLDRALSDTATLSFAASRRVTRPDPEALNPFIDHQDIHNLRAGNPNLLPQDTLDYEVGYNDSRGAISYGATAYYRFDRNKVTDIVEPVSDDVVLSTKANLPKSRSGGMEFSFNGKLGQALSYALSGNLFWTEIDATGLGQAGLASTTGANLKASLDYRVTAADTAQISFSRTDKRLTPQGWIGAIDLVNVGYKHQFTPSLAVVLTVTDLFDGQRQTRYVDTPALHDVYVRHQLGRIALFGLTYTFGASKKGKGNGFQYDQ
jgi:outer membrane receptor protein involved in Fe transport